MKTGKPAQAMGPGGQQVRAYLDRETIDKARQLGNGNFSLGLRLAVKQTGERIEKMTTLYIYDAGDMTLIARIHGADDEACEAVAADQYGDTDSFLWAYSPAFGFVGGIEPGEAVVDVEA